LACKKHDTLLPMSISSSTVGPAIRRLRRQQGLTQTAMAGRLQISPSYLNLIERGQRPITPRLVEQMVELFDFDPRALRGEDVIGGMAGLERRLADDRFADLAIAPQDIAEWLAAAPQTAVAFARLYDASASGVEQAAALDPLVLARREIERWRNHFPALEAAAEALAGELDLPAADTTAALAGHLAGRHGFAVEVVPVAAMPDALRRVDMAARVLQLSEMLDLPARHFRMARQIALLEQREAIAAIANGAHFADRAAWRLFRRHLAAYFAAALLMPYGRFLAACEETGYDLAVLQRRFSVSFEQLAHRLTTLQRPGARGLPFFMARLDRAGQYSKRYAAGSGALLLEGEASCPKWAVHTAFATGSPQAQLVRARDGAGRLGQWLTLARPVAKPDLPAEPGAARQAAHFVVVLGVEARLAGRLAAGGALLSAGQGAIVVGPGCIHCAEAGCAQRAQPPRGASLTFDERVEGPMPFALRP